MLTEISVKGELNNSDSVMNCPNLCGIAQRSGNTGTIQ